MMVREKAKRIGRCVCGLKDKEPLVLPEQALVVTEILEAIYDSAKSGKPVYFKDGRKLD